MIFLRKKNAKILQFIIENQLKDQIFLFLKSIGNLDLVKFLPINDYH